MRATVVIDVPDEFLRQRVEEIRHDLELSGDDAGDELSVPSYLAERIQAVCDDELRVALWRWPLEVDVEVVGS